MIIVNGKTIHFGDKNSHTFLKVQQNKKEMLIERERVKSGIQKVIIPI